MLIQEAGNQAMTSNERVLRWNKTVLVGTHVNVTKDDGSNVLTATRSAAFLNPNNVPVVFLHDMAGYYLLERVMVASEYAQRLDKEGK